VPFPFTSRRASKKRPAVVVGNRAYSIARLDLIVMAVTGQLRPDPRSSDVLISHWQAAGLLKPSVVKAVFATWNYSLCCAGSAPSTMTIKPCSGRRSPKSSAEEAVANGARGKAYDQGHRESLG
jgi:hypothetical protein